MGFFLMPNIRPQSKPFWRNFEKILYNTAGSI